MVFIIDCGYEQIYKLEELVDRYIDYKTIPLFDFSMEIFGEHVPKAFIISHAYIPIIEKDHEEYLKKIREILDYNLPTLGIGFGHQIIGMAYNAQASYAPFKNGLIDIGVLEEDLLFNKLPIDIQMIKDNAGAISIPPGFQLLASSDYSINEAMKKRDARIYGVQFLPELSGLQGAVIMENFVDISQKDLD